MTPRNLDRLAAILEELDQPALDIVGAYADLVSAGLSARWIGVVGEYKIADYPGHADRLGDRLGYTPNALQVSVLERAIRVHLDDAAEEREATRAIVAPFVLSEGARRRIVEHAEESEIVRDARRRGVL